VRFTRPLAALALLAALACDAEADQSQPVPRLQSIAFLPVDKTPTLRAGALIYDSGGTAIFKLSRSARVRAQAVSADGLWWEILLPNDGVGYVAASSLMAGP
jgi:hypothetical protein